MKEGANLLNGSDSLRIVHFGIYMKDIDKSREKLNEDLEETPKSAQQPGAGNQESGFVSEETLRLIVDSAPNGIIIADGRGKIVFVNTQIEQMFGYTRHELRGQNVEILVPERYSNGHAGHRARYLAEPEARMMGRGRDLYAQHKDGTEIPVEIGLNPVDTGRGLVVVSTVVDITERKRAEALLIEREERLSEIMDNTADAIIVFDDRGAVETYNREAKMLFCGGEGEINDIWEIITPENRDSFSEKQRRARRGVRITDSETEMIGKGGKRLSVSVSLVYMDRGGGRYIVTVRDISDRLLMRNKIVELEKSQIVGKMSEGFAHHMGTPLASMLLRVQMLKEDVPDIPECEDVSGKLDSIEKQILYGQRVIQRLLRFVSKPVNEKQPESVFTLFDESTEIIKPLLKKNGISLELIIPDDLSVLADSNLLHLVFSDTMMNAVDAMPEGGAITVTAYRGERKETVYIEITDTGVGISEDTIPYVFEPFYTTKPAGKGTGLGLSVAKRVIHDHGGEVSIKSKVHSGTTVLIKLPILNEEDKF